MNKTIRESLDASMSDFTWKETNRKNVFSRIQSNQYAVPRHRRAIIIALAVISTLGIATTLAATNEEVNARLFEYWPEAAKALMPVNLTSEDQGIRLEIISAVNQGSDLLVTYSLQDLEEDRIRDIPYAFLDLYYQNEDYSSHSQGLPVIYDEDERKALFAQHENYENAYRSSLQENGQITARIQALFPIQSTTIDLHSAYERYSSQVQSACAPEEVTILGPYAESGLPDTQRIIDSNSSLDIPLFESVYLSGIGMIDGQLHVQFHYIDCQPVEFSTDRPSHAFLRAYNALIDLRDSQNNTLFTGDLTTYGLSVLQWGGNKDKNVPEWEEFFFTVDPEEVQDAEFTVSIRKWLSPIVGNWEVTLPLRMIQGNE